MLVCLGVGKTTIVLKQTHHKRNAQTHTQPSAMHKYIHTLLSLGVLQALGKEQLAKADVGVLCRISEEINLRNSRSTHSHRPVRVACSSDQPVTSQSSYPTYWVPVVPVQHTHEYKLDCARKQAVMQSNIPQLIGRQGEH